MCSLLATSVGTWVNFASKVLQQLFIAVCADPHPHPHPLALCMKEEEEEDEEMLCGTMYPPIPQTPNSKLYRNYLTSRSYNVSSNI